MNINKSRALAYFIVSAAILGGLYLIDGDRFLSFTPLLLAHCDTLGGPVVKAAKKALETGNVDHVLIWVQKADEGEIRKAFQKTLEVRKLNPQAQEMADMYFFETLVRIHRAGEGAPYTGLKPAGSEEPAIAASDAAVESGNVDGLAKEMSAHVAEGIKKRFNEMMEKKKNMAQSVEAGREYVASYVTFIHYVEKLYLDAIGSVEGGAEGEPIHKH